MSLVARVEMRAAAAVLGVRRLTYTTGRWARSRARIDREGLGVE
jgi:hypothetical protein